MAIFEATSYPSLEAQVANIADAVAYSCHDLDEALQAGLLSPQRLAEFSFWSEAVVQVTKRHGDLAPEELRGRAVEYFIVRLVTDVIAASERALGESNVSTIEDVRCFPAPLIRFSLPLQGEVDDVRAFLLRHAYDQYQVIRMKEKAQRLLRELFLAYQRAPAQLPSVVQQRWRRVCPCQEPLPNTWR